MALLLQRRKDRAFWTGKANEPDEWTPSEQDALRFDDSERNTVRHDGTTWKSVPD